ncbi:MAG: hypothetical protein AABZ60_11130 [Planctomycetota bacterium]
MAKKDIFLLGIGLDPDQEGHKRITKSEEFFLVGGSKETHEEMQEKAIKFTEQLESRGKKMGELELQEFLEIADKVGLSAPKKRF